jgi:hypothetical protein
VPGYESRLTAISDIPKFPENFELSASVLHYIIIDALDENDEWREVLALMKRVVDEGNGKIKLLISSRDLDTIRELVINDENSTTTNCIALDNDLMAPDVRKYIQWRMRDLDARDLGGRESVVDRLVAGAGGLMLLAHYRIETLIRNGIETKEGFASALRNLPTQVQQYYDETISHIEDSSEADSALAAQVFVWTVFAARPLDFDALAEIIIYPARGLTLPKREILTRGKLDHLCQGMIVLRNDVVRVAHGSVPKYLRYGGLAKMTGELGKYKETRLVHSELGVLILNYPCLRPNPGFFQAYIG